ncbi:hypothetical protein ABT275_45975, partial [Streptomyces sp. NPDC001185]
AARRPRRAPPAPARGGEADALPRGTAVDRAAAGGPSRGVAQELPERVGGGGPDLGSWRGQAATATRHVMGRRRGTSWAGDEGHVMGRRRGPVTDRWTRLSPAARSDGR